MKDKDKELTKAEWDKVLWGEKPRRDKKHGTVIIRQVGKLVPFEQAGKSPPKRAV